MARDYEGYRSQYRPRRQWRLQKSMLTNQRKLVEALLEWPCRNILGADVKTCQYQEIPDGGTPELYRMRNYPMWRNRGRSRGGVIGTQWQLAERSKLLEAMTKHFVKNESGSFKTIAEVRAEPADIGTHDASGLQ